MNRARQRGSVMLLVVVLLAALFAGGAIALFVQVKDTRVTAMVRSTRASLFCAEAGLASARPLIIQNRGVWNQLLDGNTATNPAWYPIKGYVDGTTCTDPDPTKCDFVVTVRDNDDEPDLTSTTPPMGNNTNKDNDSRIFIVSKCMKYPETPREVMELVRYTGGGYIYRNQSGQGSGNTGNTN